MKKSNAQLLMAEHLRELDLTFKEEYRFNPQRKWRFDFFFNINFISYPPTPVGIEIEGGIYTQGRHTRGAGFQKDLEKYNDAAARGIFVFRFSTKDVLSGKAKEFIRERIL